MGPKPTFVSFEHARKAHKLWFSVGQKVVTLAALTFTAAVIIVTDLLSCYSPGRSKSLSTSWILPDTDPETWKPAFLPRRLSKRQQDDPELIDYVRDHLILRLSNKTRNLSDPNKTDYSQYGQSVFYDNYLGEKMNGFYIEAGAFDGETFSDSLMFETKRNWQGLLIEADPQTFPQLLNKRRQAYTVNACLSPTNTPIILNFTSSGILSGLTGLHKMDDVPANAEYIQDWTFEHMTTVIVFTEVQCLPLYTILCALGNRHVDILFLDIEGAEFEVLQTVPFHRVHIDTVNVEVLMAQRNSSRTQRKLALIEQLLNRFGYRKLEAPFYIDLAMSRLKNPGSPPA